MRTIDSTGSALLLDSEEIKKSQTSWHFEKKINYTMSLKQILKDFNSALRHLRRRDFNIIVSEE